MTTWLTPQEAAEYIKVSLPLISDAVKRGDLPAYPVGKGRNYRLDSADVDAWLKSRSYDPARSA